MSAQVAPEHVCYVHCNFCNTILAVNVPGNNSLLFNIVTVRCGHCANLLSVNIAASLQTLPLPTFQKLQHNHQMASQDSIRGACTSSRFNKLRPIMFPNELARAKVDQPIINHGNIRYSKTISNADVVQSASESNPFTDEYNYQAPEKRQRVPSAYNRFIKEEIQRIKTNNPDISHREAFSAAAKNWAHFPHIRFGLNNAVTNDENKQTKIDHDANFATQHGGAQKSPYFCN